MQWMNKTLAAAAVAAWFAAAPLHAGLIINPTFDATVTGRADAAQVEAAFNYAAGQFEKLFQDNITINITVAASSSVGLGQSSTALVGFATYPLVRTLLLDDATSGDDSTAVV